MRRAAIVQEWVMVSFGPLAGEADEDLARLTDELARDLRAVGGVRYVSADGEPGGKGVGEVVAATLAVLTAAEPDYVQMLVDIVVGFLQRHRGRRAELRVGDVALTVDQPDEDEVAEIIKLTRL